MQISRPAPGVGALAPRARLTTDAPQQSLAGSWRFRLSPTLHEAPENWRDDDVASWDAIQVPGHWVLQGHGAPAYSNVQMPFPVDPPHPPMANPIGDHVLDFVADDALLAHAEQIIRFDGIESAGEIWLNGEWLGSTRGSRLTHEFDVTGILRAGENRLAVRVAQFSDASYLENQDMWWLPGIFRDVTLLARPAGGIRDVFATADFDPEAGSGSLKLAVEAEGEWRVEIPELGVSSSGEPAELTGLAVEPWTAETPRLYDVVVRAAGETVTLRTGFRRVEVKNTEILVNGSPIMLRGVNRHEHHPEKGRVFDAEWVRAELELMKRHNINAVRTSHYPPHPDTLALFDELGFWVIDECDYESHEFVMVDWRGNPSADPAWRDALMDRIRRTVHRDKNHPAVIMWSMGNEAGVGQNLDAMMLWTKQFDPSRLVHYEGDWSCRNADVYSRMYAGHEEVEQIGREGLSPAAAGLDAAHARRVTLPFIQCEFVHAMGTGPGGMQEYWDLFEQYPRLAGGFVWEWVEQGIAVTGEDGERRIMIGGDFGEAVHDGNFVIDGLVSPDREPRPGLLHYAATIAQVQIRVDTSRATAVVENRFDHIDLSGVDLVAERVVDGETVARIALETPRVAPRGSATIELPPELRDPRDARAADIVTIRALTARDSAWAPAGHEISSGQDTRLAAPVAPAASGGAADVSTGSGQLRSVGPLAIDAGPSLGVWRAPTDNDWGRLHAEEDPTPYAERWRRGGYDRTVTRIASAAEADGVVRVHSRTGVPILDCAIDARMTWTALEGGAVRLDLEIEPDGEWPTEWARLGLDLVIGAAPRGASYLGDGPMSAYPDMRAAARTGWWSLADDELVVDSVTPQESGARQGVVDASVETAAGTLRIRALDAPFALTVSPYSRDELARKTHNWELEADGRTHVSIDLLQSGVGTASCGPGALPRYRVAPRAVRTSLLFEGRD